MGRALKAVGLLVSPGAGPFVVGGHGNEAASFFDGLAPHLAIEVVAAGIVDDTETFALEPPAHRDDFSGREGDGGLIGATNQGGFTFAIGKPDTPGFPGGIECVTHCGILVLEPAVVAGDGVGEKVVVLGGTSSDVVDDVGRAIGVLFV